MWQLLFWGSVGAVVYAYAGYPLLLYLIGRLHRRPILDSTGSQPKVCLVISAFNEEKVIVEKIENALSLQYPAGKLRIVVASDGSTDGTVDAASRFADYGVEIRHWEERRGKSAVLNDVVGESGDDVIVFTDANAMFERDAISRLVRPFADRSIGCVVGRLRYVEHNDSSVARGESAYWRYEGMISRLEGGLRSVLVANGSIFAARRQQIRPLFNAVANDFQIPNDVASQGGGVVYEPQALAFEHTTNLWREEFRRKVRIVLRGLTGFWMMKGRIHGFRMWQFVSHKLLRWIVGCVLGTILLSSAILAGRSMFFAVVVSLQALFYTAAGVGWWVRRTRRPRRGLYLPFYFSMVNLAAVLALLKFVAGARQAVWDKAESTRRSTPIEDSVIGGAHPERAVCATKADGADKSSTRESTAQVAKN